MRPFPIYRVQRSKLLHNYHLPPTHIKYIENIYTLDKSPWFLQKADIDQNGLQVLNNFIQLLEL